VASILVNRPGSVLSPFLSSMNRGSLSMTVRLNSLNRSDLNYCTRTLLSPVPRVIVRRGCFSSTLLTLNDVGGSAFEISCSPKVFVFLCWPQRHVLIQVRREDA
jgi:hypothetical protein